MVLSPQQKPGNAGSDTSEAIGSRSKNEVNQLGGQQGGQRESHLPLLSLLSGLLPTSASHFGEGNQLRFPAGVILIRDKVALKPTTIIDVKMPAILKTTHFSF